MNFSLSPAIQSLHYWWLGEVLFYALAIIVAMLLWGWVRRRIRRRAGTAPEKMLTALGAPVTLLVIGVGMQRIFQSAADNIAEISFDSSPLRTVIIIAAFFWGLLRVVSAAEKVFARPVTVGAASIDRGAMQAAFQVARYAIVVIAVMTALDSLGFSISGLLAFSGIGGAVVAFAAQKTLSNFFSGMIIFTERPFAVGDWIRCPGTNVEGVVETIGWRTTRLRTFDQRPLYVPNAIFSDNIIENPQRMTNRRIYETMGLRYDDIDKIAAIIMEIREMLRSHQDIDQTQVLIVNFDSYGESSLNFFVYALTRTTRWVEFHQIKEDVLLKVAAIVAKHGAGFAFPTRTLHLSDNAKLTRE